MPTSKFRAEPNNGSDPGAVAAIRSSFIIVRNLDDVTVPAKLSSSSSVPPSEDVYLELLLIITKKGLYNIYIYI